MSTDRKVTERITEDTLRSFRELANQIKPRIPQAGLSADVLKEMRTDLDLVAALRTSLPALLDEIDALRAERTRMRLRWALLLEDQDLLAGPDEGETMIGYKVLYDTGAYTLERTVYPEQHRCVEDGCAFGHASTCYYCGREEPYEREKVP